MEEEKEGEITGLEGMQTDADLLAQMDQMGLGDDQYDDQDYNDNLYWY